MLLMAELWVLLVAELGVLSVVSTAWTDGKICSDEKPLGAFCAEIVSYA